MAWYHRLINLLQPRRLSTDIEREVEFHLAERADDLQRGGLARDEAVYAARRRFGNQTLQRERMRDADITTWLDSAAGDVRYALRALRRSPVFTVVAVGSIALGIGATVAIYTLIDAVSLRSLPVPRPEQLLQVGAAHRGEGGFVGIEGNDQLFSNPLWEALRDRPNGFASLTAYANMRVNLADEGEARYALGAFVSGDYFRLFGVAPAAGRLFTARDDVRGCALVVVLSEGFWKTEFGRDPRVVGRTLSLDRQQFEIIGVAGNPFAGPVVGFMPRLLVPLCAERVLRGERSRLDGRSDWWLYVFGRRGADVDPRRIAAELERIAPDAYAATLPPNAGTAQRDSYLTHTFSLAASPRGLTTLNDRYGRALVTLMAFVMVLTLIACANVANLLLVRSTGRRRELAVRLALGARRVRVARQLLTESVLLAALGSASGLLVARWGAAVLVRMISPPQVPVELDLSLNWRLAGFTLFVAGLTVIIFGVVPAWRGTRVDPQLAMSAGSRAVAEGHSRFTLGKSLVSVQVALSLALVVAAGLLVGSMRNMVTEDPGFRADGVLMVRADLRGSGVPTAQLAAARASLFDALRNIPSVVDASESQVAPIGGGRWNDVVVVEGYAPANPDDSQILFNRVSSRYFATLDTRLLAGRDFGERDVPASPRVAIVNDAFARRFFRTPNVVGRQFHTQVGDTLSAPLTIIGVVENAKARSLREDVEPIAYVAMGQSAPGPLMTAELRTNGDPALLVSAVRVAARRVNPRIVLEIETLSGQIESSMSQDLMLAVL
jgi:predicted permease